MATVRFSAKLKEQILSNANASYRNAHPEPDLEDHIDKENLRNLLINQMIPAEWTKRLEGLPDFMCIPAERISITDITRDSSAQGDHPAVRATQVFISESLTVKLDDQKLRFPKGCAETRNASAKEFLAACGLSYFDVAYYGQNAISIRLIGEDPRWASFVNEVAKFHDIDRAWHDGQNEFDKNVDKLISNHATLAPALRIWPPLWDLLPSSAKAKHKEVAAKRTTSAKKRAEELDIDTTKMAGIVVASKLKGGA